MKSESSSGVFAASSFFPPSGAATGGSTGGAGGGAVRAGAGAGIDRLHRDDGEVDRRKLINGEAPVAEEAQHDERRHHHGGEDGAADGEGNGPSITMEGSKIVLSTGQGATITLDGGTVTIEGDDIQLRAKSSVTSKPPRRLTARSIRLMVLLRYLAS